MQQLRESFGESCDESRQGAAPAAQTCSPCPSQPSCSSSSPFPALWLLLPARVDVSPAGCHGSPPSCWNCRVQWAAAPAARVGIRAQRQVSCSTSGCPAAPLGAGNHPQPCPWFWGSRVSWFECSVPRGWLGEGTAGTCGAPGSKLPPGKCFGNRLAWPGIPPREGEFTNTRPARCFLTPHLPQMISQRDGTKSAERSPLPSSLHKAAGYNLQGSPGTLRGILLLAGWDRLKQHRLQSQAHGNMECFGLEGP